MSAQKLTKKELKHDGFVESTEKALEFLQRNATPIGIAVLVVVVLLVGGTYVRKSREAGRMQASALLNQGESLLQNAQFQTAMIPLHDCIEQYGGTEFGKYARVSLLRAQLAVGENENVLANLEEWAGDVPENHPAARGLHLARATALENLGRYGEAAAAYGELIGGAANDRELYDLTLRQAECLRHDGRAREGLALLEALDGQMKRGEIEVPTSDLPNRISLFRAVAAN